MPNPAPSPRYRISAAGYLFEGAWRGGAERIMGTVLAVKVRPHLGPWPGSVEVTYMPWGGEPARAHLVTGAAALVDERGGNAPLPAPPPRPARASPQEDRCPVCGGLNPGDPSHTRCHTNE